VRTEPDAHAAIRRMRPRVTAHFSLTSWCAGSSASHVERSWSPLEQRAGAGAGTGTPARWLEETRSGDEPTGSNPLDGDR
jgi:hypothetical protein